jgi:hypothetical protein
MSEPTEAELNELYTAYYEVFGHSVPTMMLPDDPAEAAALIRRAIETRDESVFDSLIPPDAVS